MAPSISGMATFLILCQIALILFVVPPVDGNTTSGTQTIDDKILLPGNTNPDQQRLFSYILSPNEGTSSILFAFILAIAGTTLAGVVIGSILGVKSDLLLLFGLFIFILGFGFVIIINIYLFLSSSVAEISGGYGFPSVIISGILILPISGAWFWSCLSWWSGRVM